jgi:heterotetrameric sarcosine oxidase gamma subunit
MLNCDALNLGQISTRAIVHLKSWMPGRTSSSFEAPLAPAECRLLTLGPGEWLLISDTVDASTLHEHATRLRLQGIAAAGPSPGFATLYMEGPAARDVLAKSCGLDLHPSKFPVGLSTRTRLAQLPVIIEYLNAKPRFELYLGRSYGSYLISWLNDALLGFQNDARSIGS